jgi:hypothetical protein
MKVVLIAVGVVTALIALALTVGGAVLIYAHVAERDEDGYFMTRHEELASPLYALVSEELDIDAATPDWLLDEAGEVRISATPASEPVFLGIGESDDVDRYLGTAPHSRVVNLEFDPFRWESEVIGGAGGGSTGPPGRPAAQDFWAVSASGSGPVTVDWDVEPGEWVAVAMNADASRGLIVSVAAGAKASILLPLGIGLVLVGLLLGATAVFLFLLSAQRSRPPAPPGGHPAES